MLRILTDRGIEYCGKAETHDYKLYLDVSDFDHTCSKAKSPKTNGICERFHKTSLQQFYRVPLRKNTCQDFESLQADCDTWITYNNTERTQQSKMCCGGTVKRFGRTTLRIGLGLTKNTPN